MIGCGLDDGALAAQIERYRALGAHVEAARSRPAELVVNFGATVDRELLAKTVEIERGCCTFFGLKLEGSRLRVSVAEPGQEPALVAIAGALGVPAGS
jgi:hypothetical protein